MSNVVDSVVRGQYLYLEEHIRQKKTIYERYRAGVADLPVIINSIVEGTKPNYWWSCMLIDKDALCKQVQDDSTILYVKEKSGTTCPTEIIESLSVYNAEGHLIWKPMHM